MSVQWVGDMVGGDDSSELERKVGRRETMGFLYTPIPYSMLLVY
jgi:hypothetical protein